jgi:CHAT domain-containing protein/Flp pilus assembly protein TadD
MAGAWRGLGPFGFLGVLALALLLLIPLQDTRPGRTKAAYDHAWHIFQHGDLVESQLEAERGYRQFQISDPAWAAKFQLLEAESMLFRGLHADALGVLAAYQNFANPEGTIQKLAIEAVALTRQQQLPLANQRLSQAEVLCKSADYPTCGDVWAARGILASKQGQFSEARRFFIDALSFAQAHHDQWLQASTSLNLGYTAMQIGHFDEAVDWSRFAYRAATDLGFENFSQGAAGNLGWAYYQLGDGDRALEQFLEAEKSAARLGNIRNELKWTSDAGYVYQDTGDVTRATQFYGQALDLAKQIDSKEDIENTLEDLAQISVDSGRLGEASAYIAQVTPMELAGGNHLSGSLLLTEGMLAAARRQDERAESLFRAVNDDPTNKTTTRLGAGEELAQLYELKSNTKAAEGMYKTTLTTFELARAQLKNENSRLSFVTNVTRVYDDYIHFLVKQGRGDEALAAADQSRARTLEQGLGLAGSKHSIQQTVLNPRQIARKTGATLLFYWLGQKQSYLWAITPAKITMFPLPPQDEIAGRVQRYNQVLREMRDPVSSGNEDGEALYKLLVAPASALIRPDTRVMILADGALSQLNFESLLAPGPSPQPNQNSDPQHNFHYWIDDATVVTAPSLAMLAATKPARDSDRSLLMLGNPVSPSEDFPSLPLFGFEMSRIEKHFVPQRVTAFAGQQASPAAYLSSKPAQYSYIHFVSHAVASRTDPLDSAIILSNTNSSQSSFKLYARDIMQHPIDARLVTISACNGSGTRSYAGEGLVGLSWAFLRAGAHSVIGALWEVSDDSTPRLMDSLYQGLEDGQSPAAALRNAKLSMLHSQDKFRRPFYWAPFQIYTTQ